MKSFLVTVLGLIAVLPATAGDLRTINNRTVDVQPIHDWRAAKGSLEARPLKHWKDLKVLELQQTISSSMHIVKADIEGSVQVITLRNMPADLVKNFNRLQTLKSQTQTAKTVDTAAKANATAAKTMAQGDYFVSGTEDFVNSVAAEKLRRTQKAAEAAAKADLARANLEAREAELAKLTEEINKTVLLAMPTGGTYAGKAEWNTGMK
jgi:hypothetical protein